MAARYNAAITVDVVIEEGGKIALVRRGREPYKCSLALPGGFVEEDERAEDAAVREAKEETGLDVELTGILGVYSDPKRDPRGRVATVVFLARKTGGDIGGGDDADEADWFEPTEDALEGMGFDNDKIVRDYLRWKKDGGTYWSSK